MTDLILVATIGAFFLAAALLVGVLGRVVAASADESGFTGDGLADGGAELRAAGPATGGPGTAGPEAPPGRPA